MSIYTRTGDRGTTAIFGGKRVSKADLQIESCGSIDELTSYLGLVNSHHSLTRNKKMFLINIQQDLYKIMACLAGAKSDLKFLEKRVKDFEYEIDQKDKKLPKLSKFILPGGSELASWFHILRVNCRKTERIIIAYFQKNEAMKQYNNLAILQYLNRLSDLFFTFARFYNKGKDILT